MQNEWSEEDLKEIAKQLSHPDGETGVRTGHIMNKSNSGMIRRAIELSEIEDNQQILEIGPGNGEHVKIVFEKYSDIKYTGVDISETMIEEAAKMNESLVSNGRATFVLSNGINLPFSDHSFDRIFTVNTIYFWHSPAEYAAEIYRVLKFNGTFCLALADKSFMEKLPFTRFGFQLYNKESAVKLMNDAGFFVESVVEEIDMTIGNLGQQVERDIILIICRKPPF